MNNDLSNLKEQLAKLEEYSKFIQALGELKNNNNFKLLLKQFTEVELFTAVQNRASSVKGSPEHMKADDMITAIGIFKTFIGQSMTQEDVSNMKIAVQNEIDLINQE